jgi:NADPH-dependent 2,4-dienoyl-CoA reductase/sulfur reductase-like enzyme
MTSRRVQLAIVGAGPAGLTAALEAKAAGIDVVVLDENEQPGGQIFRQPPAAFHIADRTRLGRDHARGRKLLDAVSAAGIRVESRVTVWNIAPGHLACSRDDRSWTIESDAIVLATGAYDRPMPLPGWTLPGVFTSGGVQALLKSQRVLAGRRVLLTGTGPLNLVLANQLADAGATVVAVLELANPNPFELLPMVLGPWELLSDGIGYVTRLARRGIPLMRGWTLLEVRGTDQVESAVIGRVDRDWRTVEGSARTFEVDTICLGYGLVPSTELSRLIGCAHRYDARLGGWIPACDRYRETSIPSVFVAGDGAGIAGSLVAAEEGRIAGLRAAWRLGRLHDAAFGRKAAPALKRLRRLGRFRAVLDGLSAPRPGLFERMTDDTVICRCEEATFGDCRKAVADGAVSLMELKPAVRAGMGICQSRICGPTLVEVIAQQTGRQPETVMPFSVRPPVKPVAMAALLREDAAE